MRVCCCFFICLRFYPEEYKSKSFDNVYFIEMHIYILFPETKARTRLETKLAGRFRSQADRRQTPIKTNITWTRLERNTARTCTGEESEGKKNFIVKSLRPVPSRSVVEQAKKKSRLQTRAMLPRKRLHTPGSKVAEDRLMKDVIK